MDIAISPAAWTVLDRLLLPYLVRDDAPVLVYWSRFVEPDGTPVPGFRRGYRLGPWPVDLLGEGCGVLQFPGRRSLYLMPRTNWHRATHYTLDLMDGALGLFAIEPLG